MKIEPNNIYNADCLIGMKDIAAESVDMILCDLPYGTTQNKWDSVINLADLWSHYKRIIKPGGAVVLTCQMPFTIALGASNLPWLRYDWVWDKDRSTGFLNAKKMPLKEHENILVFYAKLPTYNPQFTPGKAYTVKRNGLSPNYNKFRQSATYSDGNRYPTSVLHFATEQGKEHIHPTQKPVALFRYLIETYTNEGEMVLDSCIGSGTTAVAALASDRRYIGFELDKEIFQKAQQRIEDYNNVERYGAFNAWLGSAPTS